MYTSVFVVPQAIISLIPILKRPPVSTPPDERELCCADIQLTVIDHGDVFLLRGTYQSVSPVELKALATMQIQKFIWEIMELRSSVDRRDGDRGERACDELLEGPIGVMPFCGPSTLTTTVETMGWNEPGSSWNSSFIARKYT